jgi:hypothetical protein
MCEDLESKKPLIEKLLQKFSIPVSSDILINALSVTTSVRSIVRRGESYIQGVATGCLNTIGIQRKNSYLAHLAASTPLQIHIEKMPN